MSKKSIFAKTEISSVLSVFDKEFQRIYLQTTPKSVRLMKAYSKMAVIALAGWIEDGIKELGELSGKRLKKSNHRKRLEDLVSRIYGFSYLKHFSYAFIISFGMHGLAFVERKVGDADISRFSSSLSKLKKWRDYAAHSHSRVISCNPSMVIKEMNYIFPILKKIENSAREYRNEHF